MEKGPVAFEKSTDLSFDEAIARCRESLTGQGFGVLTEIDVQATLKAKLNVDREPFVILGACHAPSAYRALAKRPDVGVLLPCNVTVSVEKGRTVVRAMDPRTVMGLVNEPALAQVGEEVAAALQEVVESV